MEAAGAPTAVQTAQPDAWRPRLVMLTTGTRHAAGILDALAVRGIRLDAVVLERPQGSALVARIREARRRRGLRATAAAILRRVAGRLRPGAEPWRGIDFYRARASEVVTVGALTSPETESVLDRLRPDLLILGGAPILPDRILERAALGVLNAHPGLLPRYRGVDVVAHAVLNEDPVGATVHYVDAGIDTGRVVARVEVPPRSGERLAELQHRVELAGGTALADAVARLLRDRSLPAEAQAGERHPICRRLSPARRRAAEAKLRHRR